MFHNGEGQSNENIKAAVLHICITHKLACLQCWVFIINISEQIAIYYLSVIILSQVNYVYHNTSELVASDHLKPLLLIKRSVSLSHVIDSWLQIILSH